MTSRSIWIIRTIAFVMACYMHERVTGVQLIDIGLFYIGWLFLVKFFGAVLYALGDASYTSS